jgi:aminoglycoside/choline kinase family phosphotransferase
MLWNERLHIIDYQDARLGPHVYDLVSLLGDSYVDLGDVLPGRLMGYYIDKHPRFERADLAELTDQFSLMALQRHLKHLGTFGYQWVIGNPDCLPYVPLTLRYLEANLPKFPEYGEASDVLAELFDLSRQRLEAEL